MAKDDELPSRDLVRVKLGTDGAEAAVSEKLPAVIAAVLPVGLLGRRKLRRTLLDGLADRVRDGKVTEEDAVLAERLLGKDEADLLRLEAIRARAVQVYEALPPAPSPALLPAHVAGPEGETPPEPAPRASTAADWVRKFQDDARLVEDQTIAEIYAHILAGEARNPGSVSLRTLGALRYLDQDAAEDFDRLMTVTISGMFVPSPLGAARLLDDIGLRHARRLRLAESGLLNLVPTEFKRGRASSFSLELQGLGMGLVISWPEGTERDLKLSGYMLTTAGSQLARLARVQEDELALGKLLAYLSTQAPGATLAVAKMPRDYQGEGAELEWMRWEP